MILKLIGLLFIVLTSGISHCALATCVVPTFQWSESGAVSGKSCIRISEDSDPHFWDDNYLCSSNSDLSQWRWSNSGPLAGMRCKQWNEPNDPDTWDDNYLCLPSVDPLTYLWSYAGSISGMSCTRIYEGGEPSNHGWDDNYWCVSACPATLAPTLAPGPNCRCRCCSGISCTVSLSGYIALASIYSACGSAQCQSSFPSECPSAGSYYISASTVQGPAPAPTPAPTTSACMQYTNCFNGYCVGSGYSAYCSCYSNYYGSTCSSYSAPGPEAAEYTPANSSAASPATIGGAVAGGGCALILSLVAIYFYRQRRNRLNKAADSVPMHAINWQGTVPTYSNVAIPMTSGHINLYGPADFPSAQPGQGLSEQHLHQHKHSYSHNPMLAIVAEASPPNAASNSLPVIDQSLEPSVYL